MLFSGIWKYINKMHDNLSFHGIQFSEKEIRIGLEDACRSSIMETGHFRCMNKVESFLLKTYCFLFLFLVFFGGWRGGGGHDKGRIHFAFVWEATPGQRCLITNSTSAG